MPLMSRGTLPKVVFVASAVVLSVAYGWTSRVTGWFPDQHLVEAWRQGQRELKAQTAPPDFTNRRVYRRAGADLERPGAMQPGLTLVVSTWPEFGWQPGLRLIDRQGRTVHEWKVEPTELFSEAEHRRGTGLDEQDLHGSYLFPNGDVLVNVEYAGTVRLDACGREKWRVAAGSHHSIARADDGGFWTPGVTGARPPTSPNYPNGFPGLGRAIYHDLLLKISADGELERAIDVLDVLYANDLERHIPKNRQHDRADVVHLNDIEPLPDSLAGDYPDFEAGDLLVSLRNLDLVFVLDPGSGRVKWHASHPFIMQHDPDYLGDGWIGVFDNNTDGTTRGEMLGGSRIVALRPGTDSTRVLFPADESDPFYTAHRGKWQQLANGNRLLTESDAGRIVEVTAEGRTVWEWVAPAYSDSRVPSVTKGERVSLTREEIASWPCSD